MSVRLGLLASVMLGFLIAGTGCSNTKTTAERESLLNQNKDLQQQLDAERKAHADADARAASVASQATTPESTTPSMGGAGDNTLDLSSGPRTATGRGGRAPAAPRDLGEGVTSSMNGAGEVVLQVSGDVLFDSGKATVKPGAKKVLDSVAATIKKQYAGQTLRIEGHTDSTPVKKAGWDDNWDLGARARAVLLYLSEKGVSQKNMYIASFAANDPKSTKNLAMNRRVDIVVVRNAK